MSEVRAWMSALSGFGWVFAGLAAAVLMSAAALRLTLWDQTGWPGHVPGLAAIGWGLYRLWRSRLFPVRRLAAGWMAMVYLTPFVAWWNRAPYADYFIWHLHAFGLVALGFCSDLCRASSAVAARTGSEGPEREMRGWANGLAAALGLAGLGLAVLSLRVIPEGGWYGVWTSVFRRYFHGALVAALLPFTVAMACAWRAHSLIRRAILSGPGSSNGPS
jgi:hypothetical protein